ncbi:response regulator transcription factor [Brevibacillus centrosporus]|jgi:two-component system response regulator CiaR|uniref:response regulator transcription factor n=1 Tax=Brevibacillus centrosporus TaxID=54910 RepID=UPI000F09ED30|nr:response regulator transcription factor [Brevibacillus centrosporus]MEC2127542.1 response regulator transcription factor [Brevibacillus centrosporus]MED4910527.1 response regulator transcription factor [Brevibacillus centrosporus]RNB67836.1 DNA-binding response regulator [Brevibacillus centrosporus]GED30191.1 DNA-binding response regulator [Brevibacillus centrosporus]
MKLLIIEDDHHLSDTIKETAQSLFETTQAFDGEEGLFLAAQNIFDVIILDIMLPHLNGYEVLEQLRAQHVTTPVIMLTAKDGIDDKIHGFKKGADDYLVKPFHREELLLRLEALVRRRVGDFNDQTLRFLDLQINTKNYQVSIGDDVLKLSGKQYDLLEYLLNNRNTILTKEQIFDRIWGFDSDTSTSVVEVYASNLRKNLKKYGYDKYIKTFRGLGYMLTESGDGDE